VRHVLLLRGINLGPKRRVPMAELRAVLGDAGHEDVATYVQSGNIVLTGTARPAQLERDVAALISGHFGFDVPVIARSRAQLAKVVGLDPLGDVADNPKRYQVTFLAKAAPAAEVAALQDLALDSERLAAHGRELYTWHPDGVARSKLAAALTAKRLGANATARNWTTVTTLLKMAAD
jgi:uncharacterized protein (DUF1697 family)